MKSTAKLLEAIGVVFSYLAISVLCSRLHDYLMINTDILILSNNTMIVFVNIILKPVIAGIFVSYWLRPNMISSLIILLSPLIDAIIKTTKDDINAKWIIDNSLEIIIINLVIGSIFLATSKLWRCWRTRKLGS